eukprot:4938879-Pyramimonas_sp.AAC.1
MTATTSRRFGGMTRGGDRSKRDSNAPRVGGHGGETICYTTIMSSGFPGQILARYEKPAAALRLCAS